SPNDMLLFRGQMESQIQNFLFKEEEMELDKNGLWYWQFGTAWFVWLKVKTGELIEIFSNLLLLTFIFLQTTELFKIDSG
ncbi:hypothetical protein ACJX0J_026958, partial [Zea mays]